MANYILLRNNKEEGPYTLEQMIAKGFKPYDLVWIEGKSAGWRYPSEIAELKVYAPVVEEQPYDRFYKKSPEQAQTVSSVTTSIELNETTVLNQPSLTNNQQQETSNWQPAPKRIFVSIPANQNKPVVKMPVQKTIVEKMEYANEEKPKIVINDEPKLEEKFSQPLDDIKKLYADSLLKQTKNKQKKFLNPEKLKIAVAALALLLSGTAVGLFINKNKPVTENFIASKAPEPKVINTATIEQQPIIETQKETNPSANNTEVSNQTIKKIIAPSQKKEVAAKQENLPDENIVVDIKPVSENRKAVKRESISARQQEASNEQPVTSNKKPAVNLAKELSIMASNYKKATFGGISDLEFTITNNSQYTIDMVAAEVEYYTASKKLYKKETIYFSNVAPNGTQVQKAPNSNRGYEVKYRISLISSKELGLYTANL
ncbi:MAG: hypothetical protein HYX40_09415 [Sphingobacteriales bacterium]|nr:hypothetical protein [Sphingobacteriales bacterium]